MSTTVKSLNCSVQEACEILGVSRAFFYGHVLGSNELKTIKIGRRRLIPHQSIIEYQAKHLRKCAA